MAHPDRVERVEGYLRPVLAGQVAQARRLGLDVQGPEVRYDGDPNAGSGYGAWRNRKACCAVEGDHLAIVQDDVDVCADFVEACSALAVLAPHDVIALSANGGRAEYARQSGAAWFSMPGSRWGSCDNGPCGLYPRAWADAIADEQTEYPHDDYGVRAVLDRHGARFLGVLPAIAVEAEMRSVISGGTHGTKGSTFVGIDERAPLERYMRKRRHVMELGETGGPTVTVEQAMHRE